MADGISWPALTPVECHGRQLAAIDEVRQMGRCTPFETQAHPQGRPHVPVLVGGARLSARRREGVAFVLDISDRHRVRRQLTAELACADALLCEAAQETAFAHALVAVRDAPNLRPSSGGSDRPAARRPATPRRHLTHATTTPDSLTGRSRRESRSTAVGRAWPCRLTGREGRRARSWSPASRRWSLRLSTRLRPSAGACRRSASGRRARTLVRARPAPRPAARPCAQPRAWPTSQSRSRSPAPTTGRARPTPGQPARGAARHPAPRSPRVAGSAASCDPRRGLAPHPQRSSSPSRAATNSTSPSPTFNAMLPVNPSSHDDVHVAAEQPASVEVADESNRAPTRAARAPRESRSVPLPASSPIESKPTRGIRDARGQCGRRRRPSTQTAADDRDGIRRWRQRREESRRRCAWEV